MKKIPESLQFDVLLPKLENLQPLNRFQARDGAQLSYRFYDSDQKETVIILLHGSSAHGEYLHPLAEFLAVKKKLGQVYVPNIRGHYGSGEIPGDCTYIGQLEDDLYDLIEQFQLKGKKIYVVGHSSGGGLAIRLAGGPHGHLFKGFVLLSPAIPTAPTMRKGTAGGWARVSIPKIILLSILNRFGFRKFNHWPVIRFNKPRTYCDGRETLAYSFKLNTSYHPRYPYQKDIKALQNKYVVIIGSEDEANDPQEYPTVMEDPWCQCIKFVEGIKHLDIVHNSKALEMISNWISRHQLKG